MTTEDRTKPIRELLASLAGAPTPRPMLCGGVLVPVTRDSFKAMERILDVDLTPMDLPPDGTAYARVACSYTVLSKPGVGGVSYDGTCARCAGVEKRVRKILAEAAAKAGSK